MGVNLRNDVIFKVVFGHQKNEKILISLLNAILDLKGQEKIKKLVLTNPINLKEYIEDKLSKLIDKKGCDINEFCKKNHFKR